MNRPPHQLDLGTPYRVALVIQGLWILAIIGAILICGLAVCAYVAELSERVTRVEHAVSENECTRAVTVEWAGEVK